MSKEYIAEVNTRMFASINSAKHSLNSLRTGRASASLLDAVKVNAYGNLVPISQVGSVNVPDARLLTIQVWDNSLVSSVTKAVSDAGLGLNPIADGQLIRVPLPDLSEDRRKDLSKKANEYAEAAKVSIRNIRRDANDHFKKIEKDKQISEDDCKRFIEEVQKTTDSFIKKIDQALEEKVKEIMQV